MPAPLSDGVLSVYVLNANSLAKPHAKEQILVELQSYQINVVIIPETKFKKHHKPQFSEMPVYCTHRRDRVGRCGGMWPYSLTRVRLGLRVKNVIRFK